MTGSISVQNFSYRRELVRESSKSFHFFLRSSSCEIRIFESKYLCFEDVKQVFQIVVAEVLSVLRVEMLLRDRDIVTQAWPIIDLCFQLISRSNGADTSRCSR